MFTKKHSPKPRPGSSTRPSSTRSSSPSKSSSGRPTTNSGRPGTGGHKRKKMTEYERGRKRPPASLKKISSSSSGFFITRKPYNEDDY